MVHSKLDAVLSKRDEAEAGAMLRHRPSSRAEAGGAPRGWLMVAVAMVVLGGNNLPCWCSSSCWRDHGCSQAPRTGGTTATTDKAWTRRRKASKRRAKEATPWTQRDVRCGAEAGSRSGRRGAGADEEERKETKETTLLWLTGGRGAKKPQRQPRLGQEAERCGRATTMATPLSATSLA